MIIPGYLDGFTPPVDPAMLVNATGWLADPAVWPALLHTVGGSSMALEAFDVDPADVDAMLTELDRDDQWPVFSLSLIGGHQVHLVWRNFDGDSGWDYLLTVKDHPESFEVAALEGHFRGPAWSWAELVAIAAQPDTQFGRAQRLLLLLPALGDADTPGVAASVVASALAGIGAVRRRAEVGQELLAASARFWGAPRWDELDQMPVCLGPHSFRGPGCGPGKLALIAAALGNVA